jgi:hypothetical protein
MCGGLWKGWNRVISLEYIDLKKLTATDSLLEIFRQIDEGRRGCFLRLKVLYFVDKKVP